MNEKVNQFDDIYLGLAPELGLLRLAQSGLGWKARKGDGLFTVRDADLKRTTWLRAARNFQLRIQLRDGRIVKFDGFQRDDFEKLRDIIKANYGLQLETKEMSVKGWNWGETDFSNGNLVFSVQNKDMFEIPLNEVINTSLTAKHEVMIELGTADSEGKEKNRKGDQLVEMRFYVPGSKAQDGEGEEESNANVFYNLIKNEADIGDAGPGEGIVLFSDILCLTPRGRYDIDMFPTFLRLRGKATDYKIAYTSIIKLFLLPKPDDLHVLFVIGLDPPLRQGQTRYPFLVFQFVREEEIDVNLNLDDETIRTKYDGKLEKRYESRTYEIVSTLFKALTGRRVTIPSEFFKSYHNQSAIKCSMKANEGVLYPLDKSFLFIPKPPTFIPHSEIGSVTFSRVGGGAASASRTFDLKFNMKSGVDYSFSSINREEYANLNEFLQNKKIKTKSMEDESTGRYVEMVGESDSDEDTGKRKRKSTIQDYGGDDDEGESSPDEDFVADDSESDVAEEFDENVSDSGSGSGGSDDDDEEDQRPAKKSKK
ncbi:FACT complex subunit [Lobosporangium transversale]|uniref:FACT complex subunit POB3 n=1 Tax=Lobosporangium transversale TaxID=64571 RepID=A0A1Y2GW72_9FUNG|nr:structure-specific recognition protein-domain-containing protein [Lobosporangium transversale]KAF9910746.1 FACT complex subunit [Lobosporangium transversale]ORZ23684.1 structure-specific recognition protein-domain-containing protein [Lobosporangium transversale]|eukprot:XP_021883498.1 structure-specific recognition protein-domain-containing protein [Lobosporangium transversale]